MSWRGCYARPKPGPIPAFEPRRTGGSSGAAHSTSASRSIRRMCGNSRAKSESVASDNRNIGRSALQDEYSRKLFRRAKDCIGRSVCLVTRVVNGVCMYDEAHGVASVRLDSRKVVEEARDWPSGRFSDADLQRITENYRALAARSCGASQRIAGHPAVSPGLTPHPPAGRSGASAGTAGPRPG